MSPTSFYLALIKEHLGQVAWLSISHYLVGDASGSEEPKVRGTLWDRDPFLLP